MEELESAESAMLSILEAGYIIHLAVTQVSSGCGGPMCVWEGKVTFTVMDQWYPGVKHGVMRK
jgi:hypothetical protein